MKYVLGPAGRLPSKSVKHAAAGRQDLNLTRGREKPVTKGQVTHDQVRTVSGTATLKLGLNINTYLYSAVGSVA